VVLIWTDGISFSKRQKSAFHQLFALDSKTVKKKHIFFSFLVFFSLLSISGLKEKYQAIVCQKLISVCDF